ncbi:MAG TPA: AraC family transcriptional regulator [Bacillota bacterium]|nr:AraC family transcriptional regulator [Bacillota bacterium]
MKGKGWSKSGNINGENKKPQALSRVLYLHQVGIEACSSGHSFGPAVRDHYLIHCILEGEGSFYAGGGIHKLSKGQGFLILPGEVAYYEANDENPWHYCWVGFNGTDARAVCSILGIGREEPIFNYHGAERLKDHIQRMSQDYRADDNSFIMISRLYEFFSILNDEHDKKAAISNRPVEAAIEYIQKNYSYGISVQEIAEYVNLDRSHLFRLFKGQTNMSVQEYMLKYRLERGLLLLRTTDMNVREIMYSCGFNDLPNFSRQFKRVYGLSPGTYRKEFNLPRS